MASPERHKCLNCGEIFQAEARNVGHQKYCSEVICRKASKAASRRAWCAKSENKDYFRGPENVARVQSWRAAHPGYWRRPKGQRAKAPVAPLALQDLCPSQVIEMTEESPEVLQPALQDLWRDQPAVLIGFLAQFTGSALQDDIALITRRLLELGNDILAGRIDDEHQTSTLRRALADDPGAVQLGRSPPGARPLHRAL